MLSQREVSAAIGAPAYGPDGEKIGTVEHFYVDDRTGAPTWAAVTTGLFGTRHSIVPAVDATFSDGGLRVRVGKDAVRAAPQLSGEHLDPGDEAALRRHYGLDTAAPATAETSARPPAPAQPAPPAAAPAEPAAQGPSTGPIPVVAPPAPPPPAAQSGQPAQPAQPAGDGAMTRSEERLAVGTERVAVTRTRVVKYVVTEEVQITVPIRREEIRLEEVPLDAPDPGPGESLVSGGAVPTGGLPEEIVLHAERPVVSVEVVPVERVRLRVETVTGTEQVTDQVQREQVVVEQTPTRSGG
ncbi:PRC and DUF2382 domain-containing protein [Blastococcus sp. SYSU D00820]